MPRGHLLGLSVDGLMRVFVARYQDVQFVVRPQSAAPNANAAQLTVTSRA